MPIESFASTAQAIALDDVPTCELQWELERRHGIEAHHVGLDVEVEILVSGACRLAALGPMTITVNRD